MKVFFEKYGQLKQGDLCEITLTNEKGMTVKVLNYGATLEKVIMPDGQNMILSLKSPGDYSKQRNFLGGTVGRICGRVRQGQWRHGQEIWQLPQNDGENHIHGGHGTDMAVWNFRPYADQEKAGVELTLFDPAGHNGYPGNLKLQANYVLDSKNQLHYSLRAVSDQLTIFNPANHTYFCLGKKASEFKMQLNADYYLPVGADGLPKGGMSQVAGTAFDFRQPKLISAALKSRDPQIKLRGGLDHPFILNGRQPNAILDSGDHQLLMTTNAPALVTYTGNHFNHSGVADNLGQYDGITLEAQYPPAAGNDLGQITLLPFEEFKRTICWAFR